MGELGRVEEQLDPYANTTARRRIGRFLHLHRI
jgi:hypothetical protein